MSLLKKKIIEPLRNCPFCGSSPQLYKCGDQKEYVVYMCSYCYETPVQYHEAKVSELSARKIWNKRVSEAERIIIMYQRVTNEPSSKKIQKKSTLKHMLGV